MTPEKHRKIVYVESWESEKQYALLSNCIWLILQAVSTVATCDEDYKQALRASLYVRIREYQDSAGKAKVTPIEENATEVFPENPTVQNTLAVTDRTSSSEIVEEESEQKTFFKLVHLAAGTSNQPAEQVQQVENKPYISPEVEQALGILDSAIAILRGNKTGNISALQKVLSYDATSEGGTISSRNSHTNILNADNLPNRRPANMPHQDSRSALRDINSLCSTLAFQLMMQLLHGQKTLALL